MSYPVLKRLETKDTRCTELIQYHGIPAIQKRILSHEPRVLKRFKREQEILKKLNKEYIPKLYQDAPKHIIMEYIPTPINAQQPFATHVTQSIIQKIVDQLIDLKLSPIQKIAPSSNQPLLSIYRSLLRSIQRREFHPLYKETVRRLTSCYINANRLFKSPNVATKGDFTEVNILITHQGEVKFIDFDAYHTQGSWLEDASYLLLHEDRAIEELSWQHLFYKTYLLRLKEENIPLSRTYVHFWLLSTALKQYAIRRMQYQQQRISHKTLQIKEGHLRYFLDPQKTAHFLDQMEVD